MKSIKPGRGPSMLGGIGCLAAAIFGVIWTLMALSMGAPVPFALFGVIFVVLGLVQAIFNFKNATGKNRYSAFDIVDSSQEPDPLQQRFGTQERNPAPPPADGTDDFQFCPYCGARLGSGFTFCAKCGKRLPEDETGGTP